MHKIILIGMLLFGMYSSLNANEYGDTVKQRQEAVYNIGTYPSESLAYRELVDEKESRLKDEIKSSSQEDKSEKIGRTILKVAIFIIFIIFLLSLKWILKKLHIPFQSNKLKKLHQEGKSLITDKHHEYNRHKAEDELLKAKKLLDNGIISKEEFEHRLETNKQQLKYSQEYEQITDFNTKQPIQQVNRTKKDVVSSMINKIMDYLVYAAILMIYVTIIFDTNLFQDLVNLFGKTASFAIVFAPLFFHWVYVGYRDTDKKEK